MNFFFMKQRYKHLKLIPIFPQPKLQKLNKCFTTFIQTIKKTFNTTTPKPQSTQISRNKKWKPIVEYYIPSLPLSPSSPSDPLPIASSRVAQPQHTTIRRIGLPLMSPPPRRHPPRSPEHRHPSEIAVDRCHWWWRLMAQFGPVHRHGKDIEGMRSNDERGFRG